MIRQMLPTKTTMTTTVISIALRVKEGNKRKWLEECEYSKIKAGKRIVYEKHIWTFKVILG